MRKTMFLSLMTLLITSTFAYKDEYPVSGSFHMTIDSFKDDEFEVDQDGVWIIKSEVVVTLHLNPDSILYYMTESPDSYNLIVVYTGKHNIANYGDSVKINVQLEYAINADYILKLIVCYGSRDNPSERTFLTSDAFPIIDYIKNEDCLKAYERATSIPSPTSSGKKDMRYFDLSGRLLASALPKGLYISGGKKVLRRD